MVLILPPNKSRRPGPEPTARRIMLGMLVFALAVAAASLIYCLR